MSLFEDGGPEASELQSILGLIKGAANADAQSSTAVSRTPRVGIKSIHFLVDLGHLPAIVGTRIALPAPLFWKYYVLIPK
ncbi:hypothetical protein CVT26_014756 [Gymnopilus dilepis]|uniref:Uncharacterized protein n=1 Tax=Gymnopilus dilepis TaxID=231916 RepID=A0A409XBF7_9AGAR|nr:hypothetical protein CVT26_014756 [Gymnopilus dilepis]